VSVTVKVATPVAPVVPLTVVIVEEPVPWPSVTVWPLTAFPNASLAVTVTVELATPFAVSDVGDADTVDCAELTAAALMSNAELVAPVRPVPDAASV
jgi:hypothetical protein